jgi:hypothetical protein
MILTSHWNNSIYNVPHDNISRNIIIHLKRKELHIKGGGMSLVGEAGCRVWEHSAGVPLSIFRNA